MALTTPQAPGLRQLPGGAFPPAPQQEPPPAGPRVGGGGSGGGGGRGTTVVPSEPEAAGARGSAWHQQSARLPPTGSRAGAEPSTTKAHVLAGREFVNIQTGQRRTPATGGRRAGALHPRTQPLRQGMRLALGFTLSSAGRFHRCAREVSSHSLPRSRRPVVQPPRPPPCSLRPAPPAAAEAP